jgi:hypothetical protein
MESGAIVDYHRHKLKYINRYKYAIIVVAPELECMLNHFIREEMCHQNPKVMENPPAPSNKMSPIVVAKGAQGIKWAIGISHLISESGLSLLQKNSIS